ncbi:hypothetical protein [Dietzia sp. ANT_WB102]|uniref:hypothetical protein n=1 Tax=Dietzia sp. ANT_WB102 TaxID=2597345 RepID=UPI0011EE72C9|nr:hypothetical protein [Dietzia sp. ANT_WB102]KAA0918855.1 hypothetical protein FQ137_05955 [Dietzia sp. ANT_WB102]
MPANEPTVTRPGIEPEGPILYAEDGWSWAWILAAPVFCAFAALFELATGAPVHWLMLTVCAIATALCHGVMIAATRVHGRIRVTPDVYIQGTEELELDRVERVLPLPAAGEPEAQWETARTLGELRDVPRRRSTVGLRLDTGAEVRAWARNRAALHAALSGAVGAVRGEPDPT